LLIRLKQYCIVFLNKKLVMLKTREEVKVYISHFFKKMKRELFIINDM